MAIKNGGDLSFFEELQLNVQFLEDQFLYICYNGYSGISAVHLMDISL